MYDINRRTKFKTVGELKGLLTGLSDDTSVLICGDNYAWFHVEKDDPVICLDNEDLDECYEDEMEEST